MKKFIKMFSILMGIILIASQAIGCSVIKNRKYVEVYETTGTKSKLLERQTDLEYKEVPEYEINTTVTVSEKEKAQDIYGMGGSITHSSAYLLMELSQAKRKEILEEFFGEEGARYNFIRVPIGASDYVHTDYFFTNDDMPTGETDESLEHFNVDNDLGLINVLKEIVAINPSIKIVAVPWSAPAWMKSNSSLMGGRLKEEYYTAYAKYLVKFTAVYKQKGISFSHLSILNEPLIANIHYPHMQMNGDESASVIEILGKELKNAGLSSVKIMAYEHNYSSTSSVVPELFIDAVLDNKNVSKYVSGVAYHGYGNNGFADFAPGLEYITEFYSDKEIYITEITEHDGSVDFASNLSYALKNVIINPINYGVSAAMFWNLVLTSKGTPVLGNNSVCFGLMNLDDDIYRKNPAYYAMAHVSQFAYEVNGKYAKRLLTESSNDSKIIATAFYRADKRIVVVAHNTNDSTYEDVDFIIGDKAVTYRIMPQSVVTLVF